MLRPFSLRIYVYAHLKLGILTITAWPLTSYGNLSFVSALLTMIKFSMHKQVRILDS